MQRILACAIVALAVLQSEAACPNSCGGHGTCGTNDQCTCYQGFRGNGCEQRVCPYGRSWATTPVGDINGDGDRYDAAVYQPNTAFTSRAHVLTIENMGGAWEFWPSYATSEEAHFDMECSNAGLCDRELGQCTCFDGFEGSACDRSTCPGGNYCNGNGRCMTISQLVTENNRETGSTTTYTFWDADHMRACQCDPGFTGIGCDEMRCPLGDDPMTKTHQIPETQRVRIYSNRDYSTTDYPLDVTSTTGLAGTFTLTYKNLFGQSFTTDPIDIVHYDGSTAAQAVADDVEAALEALPNSHIPSVDVTAGYCEEVYGGLLSDWDTSDPAGNTLTYGIRCPGNSENQVVAQDDGTLGTITYFAGTSGDSVGLAPTALGSTQSGCTRIEYPFCIELQITFSDKANTGALNLLTVDVSSVTDDGKTNDQYDATYIAAEVVKSWDITFEADNVFVPSNSEYAPSTYAGTVGSVNTFSAIDISAGTITIGTAPDVDFPIGATVELLCSDGTTIYNMGKYVLASTIVGSSGTSVAFESSINDPKTRCSTTNGGVLKLVTAYVSTTADLTTLYDPLLMTYGFAFNGNDIDSTATTLSTYDTTNKIGYMLLTDVITSPAFDDTADVELEIQATGTMEADECSGRGLCDSSTGLCTCFKGYSGERCDTQNALWVGADSS